RDTLNRRRTRMRTGSWIIVAAIVTLTAGCAPSQAPANSDADRAKLEADALSWFNYFDKADADGMANLYAEDALLLPPGAPAVAGRAAIKAFLADFAAMAK